jgi:VCBS repeat-containing protein
VTLAYTVQVNDGNNGTASQVVTITVHGTEDAPTITIAAGDSASVTKTETNAGLTASGTLTVTDADLSDAVTTSTAVSGLTHTGPTGGLTDAQLQSFFTLTPTTPLAADTGSTHNLTWNFNSGSQAFDFLAVGQSLVLTYTVQASDGHAGGTTAQSITVTINGTDDVPVIGVDTVQAVPSGWSFDSANGHYYRYVPASQITWNAANTAAIAAGGYLATITDSNENTFVHNLVGAHDAWLGGSDAAHEGTWAWVTGPESGTVFYINSPQSSPGYSNWNAGEPNNLNHGSFSPGVENYLQILDTGKWNDEQGPNVPSADQTGGYVEEMGAPGIVLANFVEDTSTSIATAALLANDTDVDGGPLVVSAVNATSAHGGTLTLANGVITYTPSANFNGADQFSYTVSDGHSGGTATGTLIFNVAAVNDAPVNTVPGVQSVSENGKLVFSGSSAITISDVDVLGGTEKVTLSVNHGTLTLAEKSGLSFTTGDGTGDATMTFTGSVANINNALNGLTYGGNNNFHGNDTLTIATNDQGNTGSGGAQTDTDTVSIHVTQLDPVGIAGEPINLGLAGTSENDGAVITMTIADVPSGWTVHGGTLLNDGTWTVQTSDPGSLTITSPADFAGAMLFNVTETWTQADGSTATVTVGDNVEAYPVGSPIFALSGDDFLTASSGKDLFVFAQPIGHDTVYSFATSQDQIDLIGYAGFAGFADVQAHMIENAAGNTVITLGDGQSITLQGVDEAALTEANFEFSQTPVLNNAGTMTISDGGTMPLSGTINNTGTIGLLSTGDETDLQIVAQGVTLTGDGHVMLSDSPENMIVGTSAGVTLMNIDNTIDGSGDLGGGQLTIINDSYGIIAATSAFNPLTIDTGTGTFTNHGTVLSVGAAGLEIVGSLTSDGVLEANAGLFKIDGDVGGGGHAVIDGGSMEFGGASDAIVQFSGQTAGTLYLGDVSHFTGTVTGFSYGDTIDLAGIDPANVSVGNSGSLEVHYGPGANDFFSLAGNYDPASFAINSDNKGGTDIVWSHLAPVIETDQLSIAQNPDGTTTISGLHVSDSDPAAPSETFTVAAATDASGSSIATSPTESGSLADLNAALNDVTYSPGSMPPATDKVALTVTDSFGATDTVNLIFNEAAAGPNVTLQGTAGKDVIFATGFQDILTGGGGADQFVFAPTSETAPVQHTITDFVAGLDKIDMRQFGNIGSFADLTEAQQGNDTLLTLDNHDSLLLKNVTASNLHANDFIISPHGS